MGPLQTRYVDSQAVASPTPPCTATLMSATAVGNLEACLDALLEDPPYISNRIEMRVSHAAQCPVPLSIPLVP